eukprot:comp22660_c0_seq1/m.34966 comp22660_c0_seq1/g.34966  ORF comp22660_c0_seq1/g.34966 comp22660_c0_seq1/m.34966 type:complete len:107 (-) comp22660_c0_seq1:356-676(-)
MALLQQVNYVMAGLMAVGGTMGLAKGSKISFVAGLASACVYFYAGNLVTQGQLLGHDIATGLSVALAVMMGRRFARTGKVFPAGVVAGAAAVVAAVNGMESYGRRQ